MDNRDLKRAGLKVTLPRVKILRVLESQGPRHMSVDEIFHALVIVAAGLHYAVVALIVV